MSRTRRIATLVTAGALTLGVGASAVGLASPAGAATPRRTVDVSLPYFHNAICGNDGFVGTVVFSSGDSYDCSTNILTVAL